MERLWWAANLGELLRVGPQAGAGIQNVFEVAVVGVTMGVTAASGRQKGPTFGFAVATM